MFFLRQIQLILIAIFIVANLTSCKPFDVNVATPEPIKVDLDMDVHVYQHGKVDKKTSEKQETFRSAMDSRRARMEEIQQLKNNRLVGENHQGELSVRNKPAGEYGDYVVKTVSDENRDRVTLMKKEAEEKKVSLNQVRSEQWKHWQRKSFPGEWIEVESGAGAFQWEQKKKAGG